MRTLNVGSQELVEGLITDLRKNDLTTIASTVELAFTDDDTETAPDTGWAARDSVDMIGLYTMIPGRMYTATEPGFYKLWGRWGSGLEQVILLVGRFRVV